MTTFHYICILVFENMWYVHNITCHFATKKSWFCRECINSNQEEMCKVKINFYTDLMNSKIMNTCLVFIYV